MDTYRKLFKSGKLCKNPALVVRTFFPQIEKRAIDRGKTEKIQDMQRSLLAIKNPHLPPFSLNCIGQQRLYLSVQLVTVRTLWARLSTWKQDAAQYNGFPLVSAGHTNDIGEVRKMAYWWLSETVAALRVWSTCACTHAHTRHFLHSCCLQHT